MKGTKITIIGLGASAIISGGIDVSVLNEEALARVEQIGEETVEAKQIGNRIETTFPWKDQQGLKVVADLGEPTISERLKDKRNKEVITEVVDFGDGGFKIDILLNERPDTNRFCYQIEGAENYDFEYQPPLTEEEIKDGIVRPENIVGSYAVYHKMLKDYYPGRENYATGKVMHIPRPQVWSMANEKEKEWAELSYNDGQLCVTAPTKFIATADLPIRIDPTFGYTTLGASSIAIGGEDPDLSEVYAVQRGYSQFLMGTGTLSSISAGLRSDATSQAADTYVALYREDSAGSGSHALVVGIERANLAFTTSNAWYEFTAASEELTADTYIFSAVANGADVSINTTVFIALDNFIASKNIYQESATGAGAYSTRKSEDPWTAAATRSASSHYSIYATYTCNVEESCVAAYSTPGTYQWLTPDNVTLVDVACWGGGGGGDVISTSGGGGGGGGAYAASTGISVTPGVSYPVVVGVGGTSGTSPTAGGDSSFATTTVVADGGTQAVNTANGTGGTVANSTGTTEYAGGDGGAGDTNGDVGGGGGGAAGPNGAGGTAAAGAGSVGGGGGGGNGGNNASGSTAGSSTNGGAGGAGDVNGSASPGGGDGVAHANGGGGGGGGDDGDPGGGGGSVGGGAGGGEIAGSAGGGSGQCVITYTIPAAGADPQHPSTILEGRVILEGKTIFE